MKNIKIKKPNEYIQTNLFEEPDSIQTIIYYTNPYSTQGYKAFGKFKTWIEFKPKSVLTTWTERGYLSTKNYKIIP